ncbi:hypothetical protein [Caballeronia sordidicola]|uniref:Uncharacterized protein n=1 Tax=Caballeronia sordidicola TaxID=196367 RepID=A0A226X6P9_CABSO|nr:hypothetical protein [Caballeronia sordidicola]OXC78657.1 hypothetical protein BSU04_11035 [Caballeronia sordidicola]
MRKIDPTPWNEASIIGFHDGDYEPMRQVISGAVIDEKGARIATNEALQERANNPTRGRGGRSL